MEKNNRKLFIQILIFIIFFVFSFFGTNYFLNPKENKKIEIQMKLDSINKTLPFVFDNFVRADSISLFKNDELKYNFTIIEVDETSSRLYVKTLKEEMKNKCQIYYETNDKMKDFRDRKIVINYFYYDKNGKYLFDFVVKSKKE
jgi:hypothetical protein